MKGCGEGRTSGLACARMREQDSKRRQCDEPEMHGIFSHKKAHISNATAFGFSRILWLMPVNRFARK